MTKTDITQINWKYYTIVERYMARLFFYAS